MILWTNKQSFFVLHNTYCNIYTTTNIKKTNVISIDRIYNALVNNMLTHALTFKSAEIHIILYFIYDLSTFTLWRKQNYIF